MRRRGKSAVFGWADPGQKITVSIAGKKAASKADADGKFKVPLALAAAGGYLRRFVAPRNRIVRPR